MSKAEIKFTSTQKTQCYEQTFECLKARLGTDQPITNIENWVDAIYNSLKKVKHDSTIND